MKKYVDIMSIHNFQVQSRAECCPAVPVCRHLPAHQHPPADGRGQEVQAKLLGQEVQA